MTDLKIRRPQLLKLLRRDGRIAYDGDTTWVTDGVALVRVDDAGLRDAVQGLDLTETSPGWMSPSIIEPATPARVSPWAYAMGGRQYRLIEPIDATPARMVDDRYLALGAWMLDPPAVGLAVADYGPAIWYDRAGSPIVVVMPIYWRDEMPVAPRLPL